MEIDNIIRPYIGKWLKVHNKIRDVSEFKDEISIAVNISIKESYSRSIFLRFNKKRWKAELETMKEGDRLIAEGKIREVEKYNIWLEDCEVKEIKPKESSWSLESYRNIDPNKCDEK